MSTKDNAAAALRAYGSHSSNENRRKAYAALDAFFRELPADSMQSACIESMLLSLSSRVTLVSTDAMNRWASEVERY